MTSIAVGTRVRYHGSLEAEHGYYTVAAIAENGRYHLNEGPDGQRLSFVGRDSITTVTAPSVTITLQFALDRPLTADMIEALTNLADVMLVQAEEGLWTAGYADGDDSVFLAHMTPATATPQITLH